MFTWFLRKIVGSQNARLLKRLTPTAEQILTHEPEIQKLADGELPEKSHALKARLKERVEALGGGLNPDGSVPVTRRGEEEDEAENEDFLKRERKRRLKVEEQAMQEVLPEAFALVRETGLRKTGMRHFDVQMIGGLVLHQGMIAEMATGEGKTLVATLSVYLNALLGRGVHVITVNDYLARRDRNWMGPIYETLGLTVGTIQHGMDPGERRVAYACDVTYGTNNEFGFDYLRDNMAISAEECVQRRLSYAIVDEVDSILVDEARTPLIISGPAEESTELYYKIDRVIPKLKRDTDYTVDEKAHSAMLTEDGVKKAEEALGVENLYDDTHITLVHHINQGLRAHALYRRDVDYMVKDNQVVIVDEFTGRLMPGRRWSDGLHQAIEAKEGVKIERENQTLATITFQNYFRMYDKLAGMTGTASTEAAEFHEIYKLDVASIPTNQPLARTNHPDVILKTEEEKFQAVVEEIAELNQAGRPVLVGTVSIEKSERLGAMLKTRQIPHTVLNARYHEMEAQIVAQAGRFQGVTIATNMAGRGTDIVLGGNTDFLIQAECKRRQGDDPEAPLPEEERGKIEREFQQQASTEHDKVVELGGLHVLGTERHESRRIDNQLRGRSGRQGDPGSSRFYLSLEDELIRLFGENRLLEWTKAAIPAGEAIEHPWLTRAVETAQKRVEMHNFEIRKQLLEYDNVMNRQREVVYKERREILEGGDLKGEVLKSVHEAVEGIVDLYAPEHQEPEEWNLKEMTEAFQGQFGVAVSGLETLGRGELVERLEDVASQTYAAREQTFGVEEMRRLERWVMLRVIDSKWKDHLFSMDHLRQGIGYRVYGQQNPLVEYQHEAYQMFTQMVGSVRAQVLELLYRIQVTHQERKTRVMAPTQFIHPDAPSATEGPSAQAPAAPPSGTPQAPTISSTLGGAQPRPPAAPSGAARREGPKVGRNDPCPCGSGKKFKKCHGA